jgi:hypothetical protein
LRDERGRECLPLLHIRRDHRVHRVHRISRRRMVIG